MLKHLTVFALFLVVVLLGSANDKPSKPVPDDIPAARIVADPYPALNGIAVDPTNNLVVVSDPNRKSLISYARSGAATADGATLPLRNIIGPRTYIGMVAGVMVDPEHHEIYTANNDIEDTVVVMPYSATGNSSPKRVLSVPHQAWGLALGSSANQIAMSVEIFNAVVFYRREAQGVEAPVRAIRGPRTQLADPHGIYWDEAHGEIGVANHGNFRGVVENTGAGCVPVSNTGKPGKESGAFRPPSIAIFSSSAQGDQAPLRTIQGPLTHLDWPMGIAQVPGRDEIAVANNGYNSILIFDRKHGGNVAPVRTIRGNLTGINRPMGIAIDAKDGEVWVSNYGDHSALAFDLSGSGNIAPKRILRSAPPGTPSPGFGNPMALAYDTKRGELLVPN